eukprot:scaffold371246_cov35-Prasinocladus_malaysianus.AAC.1
MINIQAYAPGDLHPFKFCQGAQAVWEGSGELIFVQISEHSAQQERIWVSILPVTTKQLLNAATDCG